MCMHHSMCRGIEQSGCAFLRKFCKAHDLPYKAVHNMRHSFSVPEDGAQATDGDMDFADFMLEWLGFIRHSIAKSTLASYQNMVLKKIVPYFRAHPVTLQALEPKDIQQFYMHELKTVKANTVKHEHANIHKALEYAVKMELVPYNVSDRVELPKVEKYVPTYLHETELLDFLEKTKDHKLSLLFQIAIFYGMRKEEIVGLTWDEIDFDNNCFTIGNTVKKVTIDGKRELIIERKTKNRSSYRTMPLNPVIKEKLLILKKKQEENKKICGDCYDYTYNGYVFVDPMGVLYDPDYVYSAFKKVLEQYGFKKYPFSRSAAFLRFSDGHKGRRHQQRTEMARSQRHRHDGQYLRAFGLPIQSGIRRKNERHSADPGEYSKNGLVI